MDPRVGVGGSEGSDTNYEVGDATRDRDGRKEKPRKREGSPWWSRERGRRRHTDFGSVGRSEARFRESWYLERVKTEGEWRVS